MTKEEHTNSIIAKINQAAVNMLVNDLAKMATENDELKARILDLEKPKIEPATQSN